jgi:hypothetical protein
MILRRTHQVIHWLFLAVTILFLITGFGITNFRFMEWLTFGAWSKLESYNIHLVIWIPFVVLLAAHIGLSAFLAWKRRKKRP